jgi:glycosyltransferase involved in cell wall biosynthesis
MKTKIISIMNHPPAYDWYADQPRPAANWDTPAGQWVGIWGYDWPDQLARAARAETGEFDYEIWQPDVRADKIYESALEDGLVHKQFPAVGKKTFYGMKRIVTLSSPVMTDELKRQQKNGKVLLHLHGDPLSFREILSSFKDFPIILSYHGTIKLPLKRLLSRTKNIFSKLNHLIDHFWLSKHISAIGVITYQNNVQIDDLRKIYRGKLTKVTMGCDFTYWRRRDRMAARIEAGLPLDRKIFFSASNLTRLKQIDRMIFVFDALRDKYDFLVIVAGHGSIEYETFLRSISAGLLNEKKLLFTGYLGKSELLTYYSAADFFLATSIEEGSSGSVMQALACEVPVISTRAGNTAELMEQYGCGSLLDVHNYGMWTEDLEGILEGKREVGLMERETARRHYDWPNIARKFIAVYRELAAESGEQTV